MKNIVVYRLSAMGDVAMTLPIIKGVIEANPDINIVLVTRPLFANFFEGLPRLNVIKVDLKKEHKGTAGLLRLAKKLKKEYKPLAFIDLHSVLRSHIVSLFMKSFGVPVYKINKNRKAKKEAIKTKDFSKPFLSTFERYQKPFAAFGLKTETSATPVFSFLSNNDAIFNAFNEEKDWSKTVKIGIAPFAKHQQKIWPIEHVKNLIELLEHKYDCSFFLFGGGKEEIRQLTTLADGKANRFVANILSNIKEEIDLISKMDAMLAMDSGNMHFAALAGTPVFSIWGGTSPLLGFAPYKSDKSFQIEPQQAFKCRPCSVFGGKPCIYTDRVECMHSIKPAYVFEKISDWLDKR